MSRSQEGDREYRFRELGKKENKRQKVKINKRVSVMGSPKCIGEVSL